MQSNSSNIFRSTSPEPVSSSVSSSGSSSFAESLFGGYVSLSILLPVFVFIAVVLLFIMMCVLVSVVGKLTRISGQLDVLNENALRGPISPEAYDRMVQEEKADTEIKSRITGQIVFVVFVLLVGLAICVVGLAFFEDKIWRTFSVVLGLTIATVALISPFLKKPFQKGDTGNDSPSDDEAKDPSEKIHEPTDPPSLV